MKRFLAVLLSICFFASAQAQNIQSPSQFLGYKPGEKFTPHYRIVEYFKYIAQSSKNVKLQQYGTTNEGRPLLAMFISSGQNISHLNDIRKNNLRLAGIESGTASVNSPVVVWLSYNVHGNEPSSSEAAMKTLYELVNPDNTQYAAWLKNTVVVIDPCLNPDGRERYVDFYNSVRGITPDANPAAREHTEPWPGGRVNHYYFDLNRDWAWQTQTESKARLALYNAWLPEVHVDFHEQGINAPYYFAPAAQPFHKVISQWQRNFQTTIGKNNAKYFDRNGWLYFTKEEFDLLYPSYGDTYPLYNGSIGMTYEQAGIGAGLAVVNHEGDTLTLAQRIMHHYTTGISTVETASANASKLITEFKKFYDNSIANPPGDFKGYVVKNDNPDNLKALAELFNRNGIKYQTGIYNRASGYNYFTGKTETFDIDDKDMVIDAHQPKAVLLNVLMEPKTTLVDSATYDITAWALPFVYGLKTYGLKQTNIPDPTNVIHPDIAHVYEANPYAYVCRWRSVEDVRFLAALLKLNIKVRYAERPFKAESENFDAGSLIITRAGNNQPDFDKLVLQTAAKFKRVLTNLSSGFVEEGADLGSSSIRYITRPHILLVAGDGVSAGSMGEVWQLFDQQIDYPVTIVRPQDLNRIKWGDFDVAVFPDGNYGEVPFDKLQNWLRDGGKLIAMESGIMGLIGKKGFDIKNREDKRPEKDDKKDAVEEVKIYDNRDRDAIKTSIPGAIYKVNIDNTHPLGFGLPKFYYTLKLSDEVFDFLGDDGWNVGTIDKRSYVAGFVGEKTKLKLNKGLLFGVQQYGHGSVIYMADDPLFRSFWQNGKLLFCNAIFMVGK